MSRHRACMLLWGGVASVLFALLALTLRPWWLELSALDARIASAEERLQRYRRIAAEHPQIQVELARIGTAPGVAGLYIQAPSETLAGAELQRRLQQIIAAADGRLISIQLLPVTQSDPEAPARLHVRAQIQGTTTTLFEILYRIDQARPLLFVEQLAAHSAVRPERHQIASGTPDSAGSLVLQLDVFGFVRGGQST
ncbi:type II secretion system protein GspM [Marichromatium bheemlicum]|uniref:General secretion pathway protein GspM n=1 Tax=Marichromatium bheemlicum TaxID=365339 RepID=A0ABX1I6K0_9GAMM|nr:type II secretion system protein GspM [Marichromatium bheemlicum]NKN32828.1 general secretion pathway protein GspM [Marichromatium bheemlicum]